ncbi:MAG TPA: NADH-quinone oxidoreductase subunit C [Bryobacteraceae bacterium]|nr:NADH-quinone oxidoreductase subunit C [Bryobacteraceae bacterium]
MIPEQLKDHPAAAALEARFPDVITGGHAEHGEPTLFIAPARIVETCRFLKHEQGFNRLSAVTCVDWHPADPRFEVVYLLHSLDKNIRLRLKCWVSDADPEIDSVTSVWRSANWYEREVFDLFGIRFRNHPDLRRILMPTDWEGYPLRKDYPVHGYKYSYGEEEL